jgi:outer membrane protein OmpA-like peptidoglycan-associated protein
MLMSQPVGDSSETEFRDRLQIIIQTPMAQLCPETTEYGEHRLQGFSISRIDGQEGAYGLALRKGTAAAYADFLERYPSGSNADVIKKMAAFGPLLEPPAAPPRPPASYILFFDLRESSLTSLELKEIDSLARSVRDHSNYHIRVTGHSDTSEPKPERLSTKRALAVRDALVEKGVSASVIETKGMGKSELQVPTPDGVREPRNRRATVDVEFTAPSHPDR